MSCQRQPSHDPTADNECPLCWLTIQNVQATLNVVKRCDDGSDETLASKELVEKAALWGIDKLKTNSTVSLKVALTKKSASAEFFFSRAWTVPSTILHLFPGRLALKIITFLVADDDGVMVCEDLLFGLPVLRLLRVDTKTPLEANIHSLDGAECSLPDQQPTNMSKLGRLMTVRLSRQCDDDKRPAADRPRISYHQACAEEDPFPGPSLPDPMGVDQHADICKAVKDIEKTALHHGSADVYESNLKGILRNHMNFFLHRSLQDRWPNSRHSTSG